MALPSSGQLGGTPTNAEFATYIEAFRDMVSNQLGGDERYELTIASGAVTPPARDHGGWFKIDTEGNAASDTLDTITLTNLPVGSVFRLSCEDASRVVTLNHAAGGSGQLVLEDSVDFVFSSAAEWVEFQVRSTDCVEVARHANASATLAGLVELATGAEALAGSDAVRAVTSAGLASDQTKAAKGHTVLPGGLLLNWGKITFAASAGPNTDTFDKAFSGTPYSCSLGNTMGNAARITTFTTTTIGITMASSSTGDVYFWAIGPA